MKRLCAATYTPPDSNQLLRPANDAYFSSLALPSVLFLGRAPFIFHRLIKNSSSCYPAREDVKGFCVRLTTQIRYTDTVVRQRDKTSQLLREQTDYDFRVGQCLVSDENSTCWIPVRHNTQSDGDVKVWNSGIYE